MQENNGTAPTVVMKMELHPEFLLTIGREYNL